LFKRTVSRVHVEILEKIKLFWFTQMVAQ